MIRPAQLYTEELNKKFWETAYDLHYKFYYTSGYFNAYKPDDSTWNRHEFVSVDKHNSVLGYIAYSIDRQSNYAHGLAIINFGNSIIFGKDLYKAIDDVFMKYSFRKLRYSVIIGNPIEKTYDKLTKKYGGRIVGIFKNEDKLSDGNYYDRKLYELHKREYEERRYA